MVKVKVKLSVFSKQDISEDQLVEISRLLGVID